MDQGAVEKSILVAETAEDITRYIASLPRLSLERLSSSDHCPICLIPFSLIISETLEGKPNSITRLKCGHVFCLSDISEWINTPRGSCPTCRDVFLVIPEPSEEESSDGGEYIPGSDLTDDFMEEDYWTEDEEEWIDSEAELFEDNTLEESNSSWDSEQHIDEASAPAPGQIISVREFHADVTCDTRGLTESLRNELSQLRSSLESIQPSDLLHKKEQAQEILKSSSLKTKEMKRLLTSPEVPSTLSSDFQYMLNCLQDMEDLVQKLLTETMSDCDRVTL